ncbi:hypothetical protein BX616_009207 [Lobosporangium transversale]|uniref:Uncharacterized protein n=1 Tax=Lobosporangium transversale TaxID=64571 RepID=A0A1Y2G5K0_9FUNG|nr:hypothetical protein BCR41DRAFT_390825 [Lobosporangium transversale]KAF9913977.1 hypothetical protein BX616_009207 [Lobosporangium transversale]ORY95162.1 hypothetical protein BCR41DRAFT_390825 [Lobosporangium transversale]|eukprot:XP_021875369.1 hypothetical protein BCR41DRAFT_390825 [Lobosporangium transversale]
MKEQSITTRAFKSDKTTTIVHTTTIISEDKETISDNEYDSQGHHGSHSVVDGMKKTLQDYWFPFHTTEYSDENVEEEEKQAHHPPHFEANSVMRRAYDYWKSLTQDAEEAAKEAVTKAREARDATSKEAKWAIFGYKKEAREAYEAAEQNYRDALAKAERIHEEALEKARTHWFQQSDSTQIEVSEKHHLGDKVGDVVHKNWEKFKAAVDSLASNPPKYACSPSSQYWFSRQNPAADSGWDCREIWERPSNHKYDNNMLKALPKKHVSSDKVQSILESLFYQAGQKAKDVSSSTSYDMKSVKDYYQSALDRISRNELGAVGDLDSLVDKIKAKLDEAKYYEEQTESWLTSQWNAVVDSTGDLKDQYDRVFKDAVQGVKKSRTDAYTAFLTELQTSASAARSNIEEALENAKRDASADKAKVQKAIHDAASSFSNALKETEAKMKTARKNSYDAAIETFNKGTAQLKAKLEAAAKVVRQSGSSISYHASKSVSSAAAKASQSGEGLRKDASRKLGEVKDKASEGYDRATASLGAMWGTTTPVSSLTKVHDSYMQLLSGTRNTLFGSYSGTTTSSSGNHEPSSMYGAVTALYLLFLVRQIWLRRKCCAESATHGGVKLTTRELHHSHNRSHGSDSELAEDQSSKHGKHSYRHHDSSRSSSSSLHQDEHQNYHYNNSFEAVLKAFTSVAPMTMIFLVLLELTGFTRIGLHTLFVGLAVSQLFRWSYFNDVMRQLGIVGEAVSGIREIGYCLAWTVFALAGAANALNFAAS